MKSKTIVDDVESIEMIVCIKVCMQKVSWKILDIFCVTEPDRSCD